jgi:hypothetical protein
VMQILCGRALTLSSFIVLLIRCTFHHVISVFVDSTCYLGTLNLFSNPCSKL